VTKALEVLPGQEQARGGRGGSSVAPFAARRAGIGKTATTKAALTMKEVQAEVLSWDYFQQVQTGRRSVAAVRHLDYPVLSAHSNSLMTVYIYVFTICVDIRTYSSPHTHK
jgi:hypothetical protein